MTHMDGPNIDHMDIEYNPRYGEDNLQVWGIQPYYSTFYNRKSVKKWLFWTLSGIFSTFEYLVGTQGGQTYVPYLDHSFLILRSTLDNNFSRGQWKAPELQFKNLYFWHFLAFFDFSIKSWPIDQEGGEDP